MSKVPVENPNPPSASPATIQPPPVPSAQPAQPAPVDPSAGELPQQQQQTTPRFFDLRKSPVIGFLLFEKMITPWLLIVLYWLSILFFVGFGLFTIIGSFLAVGAVGPEKKNQGFGMLPINLQGDMPINPEFGQGMNPLFAQNKGPEPGLGAGRFVALGDGVCFGFAIMIFGPIVSRVYFEILIVIFRINTTLLDIRDNLKPPS